MKKTEIVIGSRESQLAVLQSQMVQKYIQDAHPELQVEILTMKTTGDKILDRTLDKVGGKGLFAKRAGSCAYGWQITAFCTQSERFAYGSTGRTASSCFFQKRRPKRCTCPSRRKNRNRPGETTGLFQPQKNLTAERDLS